MIPALSTAAQPSAGDIAALVDTIRAAGVKAIFAESSVNPKVEQAIAREAGARVGPPLWADSLGPAGSDGATYIGSIAANTRALAEGFTGGALACRVPLSRRARRFSAPYIQRGIVEILLLAVLAGVLGTWVVLRRLPFFTHAVGTATFPGLVVAGPWGVPAQLTALGARVGFGGVLERLQRTRRIDTDAATGLLLVAALAIGVVLASDVYESGAGVDRLLFGSLIALDAARPVADRGGRGRRAGRATARCAARWLATGFDPGGARALGVRTARRTACCWSGWRSRSWSRSTPSARCWSPSS